MSSPGIVYLLYLRVVSTFLFLVFEEVLRLLLVGSLSSSETDSVGLEVFECQELTEKKNFGLENPLSAGTDGVWSIVARRTHAHTRQLMETEAGMSREAWGRAMDASDLAHGEVISLRTTVHAQMSEITELQSADHRRQRAISDLLETDRRRREEMRELRAADRTRQQQLIQTLTAVQTLQRETIPLQGLVTTLQGQVTALQGQVMILQEQVTALQGQQGPTGGPVPPELPEEAGSSS
ncbi:hypothetical protein Tco_0422771 [Tanacetum coccineum]